MKTKSFFLKTTILSTLLFAIFSLTNCKTDDNEANEPAYYFSTTDHYGKTTDSTQVRNDAVGKWYDTNNNLTIDISKGYKNPKYPFIIVDGVKVSQSYYAYELTSNVDGYPISNPLFVPESSKFKNNVNLGGMFHLIVEGNNGWLWSMRNTPIRIRVTKK